MCGEGFQPSEVCVTAEHGKVATFECSEGFFASVAFASYGRVNKYIGPRYPWCAEGPSGFEPDEDVCVVDNRTVVAVLMKACQNKNKCEINVNLNTFGGQLPCADSARGKLYLGWITITHSHSLYCYRCCCNIRQYSTINYQPTQC